MPRQGGPRGSWATSVAPRADRFLIPSPIARDRGRAVAVEGSLVLQLSLSLALGLLVGLERERREVSTSGVRTFPLLTLLGTLCALLADAAGEDWLLAAGLLATTALLVLGWRIRREQEEHPGLTTEVAALVMFAVGGAVVALPIGVPVVTTGVVTLLLHFKRPLHRFVRGLDDAEVRSIVRLVLIALVVLPVLPREAFGPLDAVNPYEVWLVVVLIVGISVGGYLVQRLVGARTGTILAGVLGGVISSTATTAAYARRVGSGSADAAAAQLVIQIAAVVVFARVAVEVALVAPGTFADLTGPLGVSAAWTAVVAGVCTLVWKPREQAAARTPHDPSSLGAAVTFGALYAAVLLGTALAKRHFGPGSLYGVAVVSGLTDMDAITISTAQMVQAGKVEAGTGWRMILLGSLSNMLVKAGTVAALGNRRLALRTALFFGASIAGGVVVLLTWPGP